MFFVLSKLKKIVAKAALQYVHDGMILGVGSGSTVRELIELLSASHFRVKCVPTSYDTELILRKKNLSVLSLQDTDRIDLAIDGADSVFLEKGVIIKGGGGALLREKIVDYFADELIIIVTEEKVGRLFPVPVEVLPFAYSKFLLEKLSAYGTPTLRMARNKLGPVVTDNGNWIIDVKIPSDIISRKLEDDLRRIPGVFESGIFTKSAKVLIAREDGDVEEAKI